MSVTPTLARAHDEAEDAAYHVRSYNFTRERERLWSVARREERVLATLVTSHGHPRAEAYEGPQPAAAKRTAARARAQGFEVIEREHLTGHVVEGLHRDRGVGFRAHWVRGKTAGGTWHTIGRDVWRMVDITDRPIGVDLRAFTTKAGHRHDADDRTRMVLVSSQRGVYVSITQLASRLCA